MPRTKNYAWYLKAFFCLAIGAAFIGVAAVLAIQRANADRWDAIDEYNDSVEGWQASTTPRPFDFGFSGPISRITLGFLGLRLANANQLHQEFSYRDDKGGREDHDPDFYIAYLSRQALPTSVEIVVTHYTGSGSQLTNTTLSLGSAEPERDVMTTVQCSTPSDPSECQAQCALLHPPGAVYDQTAGFCKHTYKLVDVCAALSWRHGSPRIAPCYRAHAVDWGAHGSPVTSGSCTTHGCGAEDIFFYDSSSNHHNMEISLRHHRDPYIAASRITAGCTSCTSEGGHGPWANCDDDACFGDVPIEVWVVAIVALCGGILVAVAINAFMVGLGVACYAREDEHESRYGDLSTRKGRKSRCSDVDFDAHSVTPGLTAKMHMSPKAKKSKKKRGARVQPTMGANITGPIGSTGSSATAVGYLESVQTPLDTPSSLRPAQIEPV